MVNFTIYFDRIKIKNVAKYVVGEYWVVTYTIND